MQHEVGTILLSTWGWDQTNRDFWQVTQKNGKTMNTIRQIESHMIPSEHNFMVGTCTPIPNLFTGPSRRVKPDQHGWVRLTSYSAAGPWDGLPKHWTSYA
jgi:hypothetical protein